MGNGSAPPPGTQWWTGPLPDDKNVLQPGQQVSRSFLVSKYYELSRPGKYSIIARVRSDAPIREWFYSNEIQVVVAPALSQGDPIRVISASMPEKTGVEVAAELNGVPAKMMCRFVAGDCAMPQPGDYLFVAASVEAEGYKGYDDCLNVYLYSKNEAGGRDQRIGLYCLLP